MQAHGLVAQAGGKLWAALVEFFPFVDGQGVHAPRAQQVAGQGEQNRLIVEAGGFARVVFGKLVAAPQFLSLVVVSLDQIVAISDDREHGRLNMQASRQTEGLVGLGRAIDLYGPRDQLLGLAMIAGVQRGYRHLGKQHGVVRLAIQRFFVADDRLGELAGVHLVLRASDVQLDTLDVLFGRSLDETPAGKIVFALRNRLAHKKHRRCSVGNLCRQTSRGHGHGGRLGHDQVSVGAHQDDGQDLAGQWRRDVFDLSLGNRHRGKRSQPPCE